MNKVINYDRDIICLPKDFEDKHGTIKIPRKATEREYLANNGLIGKIRLSSPMTEDDIFFEIQSVFSRAMNDDPFLILKYFKWLEEVVSH